MEDAQVEYDGTVCLFFNYKNRHFMFQNEISTISEKVHQPWLGIITTYTLYNDRNV